MSHKKTRKRGRGYAALTKNNAAHVGTYAEEIRPWQGIYAANWLEVPYGCKCFWSPHEGRFELKFAYALCPIREHSRLCLRMAV